MKTLVITSGADVRVRPEEVRESCMNVLAMFTLRAVERYFKIPGVQEEYEKWLVEYKKKKGETEA